LIIYDIINSSYLLIHFHNIYKQQMEWTIIKRDDESLPTRGITKLLKLRNTKPTKRKSNQN